MTEIQGSEKKILTLMQNFDRISALAQNIDQSQRSISFFFKYITMEQ